MQKKKIDNFQENFLKGGGFFSQDFEVVNESKVIAFADTNPMILTRP